MMAASVFKETTQMDQPTPSHADSLHPTSKTTYMPPAPWPEHLSEPAEASKWIDPADFAGPIRYPNSDKR